MYRWILIHEDGTINGTDDLDTYSLWLTIDTVQIIDTEHVATVYKLYDSSEIVMTAIPCIDTPFNDTPSADNIGD